MVADDAHRTPGLRRLVSRSIAIAGALIVFLALAYVARNIVKTGVFSLAVWQTSALWSHVAGAALLFALGLVLVAEAWRRLVQSTTHIAIPWPAGFSIYATSQLYKYLPTSLLHFVGRHVLLRRRGVSHASAFWGSAAEIVAILTASVLVALVFGAHLLTRLDWHAAISLVASGLAGLAIAALLFWKFTTPEQREEWRLIFLARGVASAFLQALALHITFRIVSGLGLWWTAQAIPETSTVPIAAIIAIWATAWTAGYVTPGALAGIGVREAVLIAGLHGAGVDVSQATSLALAYRLVTTLGDVLFAAAGWTLIGAARWARQSLQ